MGSRGWLFFISFAAFLDVTGVSGISGGMGQGFHSRFQVL